MDAKTLERLLNQIAAEHLHIDTLATRNSDRLDFHEVSVWGLKDVNQRPILSTFQRPILSTFSAR